MAGESPDRSKQRESSEEPTSGSAGPVPGARGESGAGARDPRIAVARERESTARGGVDTATRVFSRPPRPAEAEDAGADAEAGSDADADLAADHDGDRDVSTSDTAADPASGPGGAAGADSAGGTDGTGSTRLRAAVAAWVAGADEDEESGSAEGAADGARPDADAGAGAGADPARDAEPDAPDDAPEGAEGKTAKAAKAAEESEGVEGAADEDNPDADPEADPEADADTPVEALEGGEEPAAGLDGDPGATGPSEAADEAPEAAEGPSGASDEDSSEPKGAPASESDAPTEAEADPDADPDASADADSGADAEARAGADTAARSETGTGADPRIATAARVGADSGPGAESGADAEAEADSGTEAGTGTAARADADGEADSDAGPGADADSPASAPSPPVDQPTAIFKAPRPPAAPSVDQPTTMLKLGDVAAAKPQGDKGDSGDKDAKGAKGEANADAEADVEADAGAKSESVAERTSKFVALKQWDDPTTRKPPPATGSSSTRAPQPPKAPGAAQSPEAPKVPVAEATAVVPQVGPERTTQQPLPPLPPLDLLAELTNTPPPRNTAVRSIVRRVKIWTPVAVLLAIVFAIVQTMRPLPAPELTLTAKDSYKFDGTAAALPWPSEGQGWMDVNGIGTMGKFGEQKPVAIGSVAKAMTAYIVLKDHPLKSGAEGEKITVDATAETEGGYNTDGKGESTLDTVKKGDILTLKQALSAVMIPSANNIARLLARWDSGTEAAFIKKMNDTAKELGMKNTVYTDASGLKETTVSTAEDQVKLGNELVKMPALMDITTLPNWVDPSGKKWRNYNDLVPYNGAIGIKTGTTSAAGGNLLFAATKEVGGETAVVVGAILGQHTAPIIDTVNAVSRTAMIAAREALLSSKILKKGDVVGYVDDGLGGQTPVVLSKDVTAVGWAGREVELSFAAADDLPHSAKAGTAVGSLTVGDGKGGAVKVPVQLQTDLAEPGFDKKLTRVG